MNQIFIGKMGTLSRILFALASVLLLLTFIFPLWKIQLWAPQYPEGLSLQIWSSKFTGDVGTVNILNHYVGMAKIEEANFPELSFFPKLFGLLAVACLLVAIIGRKSLARLCSIGLLLFSFWSMYDFYAWEYKFGHDLNPDAAIKMDDMIYQPPLIGEKDFLNITAASWPDFGGYSFMVAIIICLSTTFLDRKTK